MSQSVARIEGQAFALGFDRMKQQIIDALPKHVPYDRFKRVVMLAVQREPKLLQCDQRSLFMECQKAASDGLMPDGKEGALIYRWNTKAGCNMAQWMPMVAGLMKLARNSGEIASLTSQVVFEGEQFEVTLGDEERIDHKRRMDLGADAKIVAAYAIATLKNGEKIREVLTRRDIEKIRNANKDWQKGPWVTWEDEMSRKAATRRLNKKLPQSTDRDDMGRPLNDAARLEDAVTRGDDFVDGTATEIAEVVPIKPTGGSKLDLLEHDEQTGEITETTDTQTAPTKPTLYDYIYAIENSIDEPDRQHIINKPEHRDLVRSLKPAEVAMIEVALKKVRG